MALLRVVVSVVVVVPAIHFAVAPVTKFVPLMVSVNAAPPATAVVGLRLVMVGLGGLTVNVAPVEVPPEVVTVTLAVPTFAISVAGTAAVSTVALLNVVVRFVVVVPAVHFAVAPDT